jgi:hypothetical protein
MHHRQSLALLGALWLIHACASNPAQVSTAHDPFARFPAQATYRWDERAIVLPEEGDLLAAEPDLTTLIRTVTDREFAKRGYRAIDSGPPHYWLSYALATHRFIGVDASKAVGSLSLTLVDAGSRNPVWTGFLRAEIFVGLTRQERERRLGRELARLLEDFPPRQRGD